MFAIVIIMKKRVYKKIRKLLPRTAWIVFIILLITYSIIDSIDSFITLHNGAPYASIAGHKYSPVVNETLILALAGMPY